MSRLNIRLKARSFTLIELLYVMGIISLVVPAMFTLYNFIIKSNREISARQAAIQQGYEFFERLNILVQDYRIDYEEYFNRQMVGCNPGGGAGSSFKWYVGTGGYCKNFTTYGNGSSTERREGSTPFNAGYHDLYYCSSEITQDARGKPMIVKGDDCGTRGTVQSYGQYATLFRDVKGGVSNKVGDLDDEDLGHLLNDAVKAIEDSDNIQELYLISQDGKTRLYFRRKLVRTEGDYTQYKIQMLRLKGFDAGRLHNFDLEKDGDHIENRGRYDGVIDTWACDAGMGFEPKDKTGRLNVGGAYSGYYIPANEDDCWIDMTYGVANVLARKLSVSPTGNPDFFWSDVSRQINDYIKIFLINGVYMPSYGVSMAKSIADFIVPLQTTINMETFYN